MRPEPSEFAVERDRALGAALRVALDRPDDAAFGAAVLARARAAGVGSSRAVLARWTRVAVAAALLAGLMGGTLARARGSASPSLDAAWVAATTGSPAAAALVSAERPPDATVLFAAVIDN